MIRSFLLAIVVALTAAGGQFIFHIPPAASGTNPIAANRLPSGSQTLPESVWSSAGASITNRTTQCGSTVTLGANAATNTTNINTAIQNCTAGQFVLLPSGDYNINGIDFAGKSNITLRGAGANSTKLTVLTVDSCIGIGAGICVRSNSSMYNNAPPPNIRNITGSPAKGATSFTISNLSNLAVGRHMIIDQLDDSDTDPYPDVWVCEAQDSNCVVNGGSGGPGGTGRNDNRAMSQIVKVVSCSPACGTNSSGTVTFTPGLYDATWSSGKTPQVWYDSVDTLTGVGVEDLSIDCNGQGGQAACIMILNADNCWIARVRTMTPGRRHVFFWQSHHLTLRDSYHWNNVTHQSTSYGIEIMSTSDALIENNIFHYVTAPIISNGSDEGTVIAYNLTIVNTECFTVCGDETYAGFWHHGAGTHFVLLEGNSMPQAKADDSHGTGSFITFHRNYLWGRENSQTDGTNAASVEAFNRFFNFTGNVLGVSGFHDLYECTQTSGCSSSQIIWRLGPGNSQVGGANDIDDARVKTSLFRWGNWDVVTSTNDNGTNDQTGTRWNSGEVPSGIGGNYAVSVPSSQTVPTSLYKSAKPSFFKSSDPWPIIGPDVTSGGVANTGGHVNMIPAEQCYRNVMGGTSSGTTVLAFTCSYPLP